MPKVRKAELSFLYETRRLILFYISTKYHQNFKEYSSYRADTTAISKTKLKEITPKIWKPELSFLHATSRLVLFYISTKYHKNIPKGI